MANRGPYHFDDVARGSLILAEGIDDARFLDAFLRVLGKSSVQIAEVKGVANFRPFITGTLVRAQNFMRLRKLFLVRDADQNVGAAFQSIQSILRQAQLPIPKEPWKSVQQRELTVSVAILPDENSEGNLEDLCLRSFADDWEDSKALKCVENYLFCRNPAIVPKSKRSKAKLHSYLAIADGPGRRLGEAADAGVWDWESPALKQLADFLRQL
jgi:hypothetical protein